MELTRFQLSVWEQLEVGANVDERFMGAIATVTLELALTVPDEVAANHTRKIIRSHIMSQKCAKLKISLVPVIIVPGMVITVAGTQKQRA